MEKAAAVISTLAALVIVVATFAQWWDITTDGGLRLRPWIRVVLIAVVLALVASLVMLLASE